MSMVYCRCCGKEIHETAPACPHCGGSQNLTSPKEQNGVLLVPLTAFIISLICVLALFDNTEYEDDFYYGGIAVSLVSIIIGAISLKNQSRGKGLAITAIVLSSIAFLTFLSLLIE